MIIDLPLILLCLCVFSSVVTLVDYFLRGRKKPDTTLPVIIDYARSLFPVFVIVFLLRSFVAQPYYVPSGSLEPTVIPGDLVIVNQYDYGLHFPVWRKKILSTSHPKRGQIALFYWPVNSRLNFIKRVIGVPGDTISYVNKVLTINGKKMRQKFISNETIRQWNQAIKMAKYEENLNGLKHDIYICAKGIKNCPSHTHDFYRLKIPKGHYLMMGDNRDNSDDSRDWGLVPEHDFIGRAMIVLVSWDSNAPWYRKIRWHRSGKIL